MSGWLLVRPASPPDADALVELGRSVDAEGERWLTYDRRVADERRNLKSIRRSSNVAVYVAESEDGVVGRLSIARDSNPTSHHVAELGLMVAAEARRRGIGTALMQEAVKWARASGVTKIELHVFPHNEPALALYRKLGFEQEGVRAKQYWIDGRHVDAVLMALHLD